MLKLHQTLKFSIRISNFDFIFVFLDDFYLSMTKKNHSAKQFLNNEYSKLVHIFHKKIYFQNNFLETI